MFIAILTHDELDPVTCTVSYDRQFEFAGYCSLPFGVSSHPAVGDFELAVYYGSESPTNLIGGATTKFRVHHCPEEFYASRGAASCETCPADKVRCSKNSTITKLELRPGQYRLNDGILAEYIRSCPNPRACKGGVEPGDASCARGHTSTLCARCAPEFFRAGDACVSCSSSKRFANSWGWFAFAAVLLVAALVWYSRRMSSRAAAQRAAIYVENVKASCGAMPKIIFSGAQILAAYSHLATDALPENLRSFVVSLDWMSFDIVSATTLPCWDTRLGQFAAKLVFATSAPAICISVMWVVHLARAVVLPGHNREQRVSDTAGWSLLVLYLVLPSSTNVIFSAFRCDHEFGERGASFLSADYGTSCASEEYEYFIRPWGERARVRVRAPRCTFRLNPTRSTSLAAIISVVVYPIGVNLFYAIALLQNPDAAYLRFLTSSYSSRCYFWEPIDSVRRCAMIGLVAFFGTQSKLVLGVLLAFSFQLLYLWAEPYEGRGNARVSAIVNGETTLTLLLLVARQGYHDISPAIEKVLGLSCILTNLLVVPIAGFLLLRDVKRRFDVLYAIEHRQIQYALHQQSALEQMWRAGAGSRRLLRNIMRRCIQISKMVDADVTRLLALPLFRDGFGDASLGLVYERAVLGDHPLSGHFVPQNGVEMMTLSPLSGEAVAIAEEGADATTESDLFGFAILESLTSTAIGTRRRQSSGSRHGYDLVPVDEDSVIEKPTSRAILSESCLDDRVVTVAWAEQTIDDTVVFSAPFEIALLALARNQAGALLEFFEARSRAANLPIKLLIARARDTGSDSPVPGAFAHASPPAHA